MVLLSGVPSKYLVGVSELSDESARAEQKKPGARRSKKKDTVRKIKRAFVVVCAMVIDKPERWSPLSEQKPREHGTKSQHVSRKYCTNTRQRLLAALLRGEQPVQDWSRLEATGTECAFSLSYKVLKSLTMFHKPLPDLADVPRK